MDYIWFEFFYDSSYFQNYLEDILCLFIGKNLHKKKTIEIGCGKGYFLERLLENGFEVTGFDPAYEGDNPHIIKDYFSDKYSYLNVFYRLPLQKEVYQVP